MSPVKAIPEGYHSITPSLTCSDAAKAIEYYKTVFGATELMRMKTPDGSKISHAELKIGDSNIFVNDEFGPPSGPPSGYSLFLYVQDADVVYNRAVAAGAKVNMALENQFWGDRFGQITDPFGHHWGIATHVEDLTPEEIGKRAAAFFAKAAGQSA